MAEKGKRLQSGELFQDPPSRPEAPRSAESQQSEQTAAEWCSFSESFKNLGFIKVFGPVATSISRKPANGFRAVHILSTARPSHQDRDEFSQDAEKMSQHALR